MVDSNFILPQLNDEQFLYLEQLTQMGYDRMLLARLLEMNPGLEDLSDIIEAVENHRYAPSIDSI